MATKMGLVSLSGQGDHYFALVPQDIIDWINREDTPGRHAGESAWFDDATPPALRTALAHDTSCVNGCANVTIGSYENDRALVAVTSEADCVKCFDSVREMTKWAADNGVEIVDEFYGCIY